jgi:hypothetical protein
MCVVCVVCVACVVCVCVCVCVHVLVCVRVCPGAVGRWGQEAARAAGVGEGPPHATLIDLAITAACTTPLRTCPVPWGRAACQGRSAAKRGPAAPGRTRLSAGRRRSTPLPRGCMSDVTLLSQARRDADLASCKPLCSLSLSTLSRPPNNNARSRSDRLRPLRSRARRPQTPPGP